MTSSVTLFYILYFETFLWGYDIYYTKLQLWIEISYDKFI